MFAKYAVAICFAMFPALGAGAQDRMPPIPKEKMSDAQKKAADELIAGPRGALTGPFVPLLRSPELMSRLQRTGEYLRFQNSIGEKLTEFLILLTARQWTQQYEFDVHTPLAVNAGVRPELVTAITEGRRPRDMTVDEEVVYDFFTELHENQSVTDSTYARAVGIFGEQGVVDMSGLIGYYTTLAMVMNVARTPMHDGKKPPLAPFPH